MTVNTPQIVTNNNNNNNSGNAIPVVLEHPPPPPPIVHTGTDTDTYLRYLPTPTPHPILSQIVPSVFPEMLLQSVLHYLIIALFLYRFDKFPEKCLVWEEIVHITEALEGHDLDPQKEFLKGLTSELKIQIMSHGIMHMWVHDFHRQ